MISAKRHIAVDDSLTCRIVALGDVHIGCKQFDRNEDLFLSDIDWIKNTPNTYWIGMGDYCECIDYRDPRFDPRQITKKFNCDTLSELAKAQADYFTATVADIKDKCLGLLDGNHEEKFARERGFDITKHICGVLGFSTALTPDGYALGYITQFHISVHNSTKIFPLKIFAWHGASTSVNPNYQMTILQRKVQSNPYCHIYLQGHGHHRVVQVDTGLDVNTQGHLYHQNRIYALTGSYRQTYTEGTVNDYGERRGYAPTVAGCAKIQVRVTRKNNKPVYLELTPMF